jgi:hypothetical protein
MVNSHKVVHHKLSLHLAFEFIQIFLSFFVFQILVLVVMMVFKAPNYVKRKPFVVKCVNLKLKKGDQTIFKKTYEIESYFGSF